MERFTGLVGIGALLGIAWLLSEDRRRIDWKLVARALALQVLFALIVLKTALGRAAFDGFNKMITQLLGFTNEGSEFLFDGVGGGKFDAFFSFVTHVLPTIIFFSALMSVLYYLGVMQLIVKLVARVIVKVLGTSGAETLSCSANIFVGQTEAPLLIKPFVEKMTRSELMTVMVGGFATVAGGVMAAYVGMLSGSFPDIAGHLMAASVMAAPGAIMISKILVPETEEPVTRGDFGPEVPVEEANVIEAAASGAASGLQLALNVAAMLLAFLALVAMMNAVLEWLGALVGLQGLTLDLVLGTLFSPLAFILGVPWKDAQFVGQLLGTKLAVNEFVAYSGLSQRLADPAASLSPKSVVIASYALCGFANLSSIGIQIGGIGGIAPSRRSDLARLGLRAMLAGAMTSCLVGALAGVISGDSGVQLKAPAAVSSPAQAAPAEPAPAPAEAAPAGSDAPAAGEPAPGP